ncbi:hypothetical protein NKI49_33170, partial [Mesorhizobium sp. M0587]
MLGASVLQPGHSTARHHDAPDSSVVDLNPPAPFDAQKSQMSVEHLQTISTLPGHEPLAPSELRHAAPASVSNLDRRIEETAAQAHGHAGEQGPISRAQQVAPAPFERHLGKTREAQDGLTSTLDRSNLVNSGGVIINNEHYTALLR